MKSTLIIMGLALGLLLVISLWGFYQALYPIKLRSEVTPKNFGVDYETISFRTRDNLLLKGWFIPHPNPNAKTIILLHGYPADKGDILSHMIFLHHDYHLLLFDFRYMGESEGRYSTIGKNEVLDLLAALDYLRTRGIREVGVWGLSMGASVALLTAPLAPDIKAIVVESPYARLDWMTYEYYHIPLLRYPLGELTRFWAWLFLGYDLKSVAPVNVASHLNIPILLIHSEQDEVISFKHALFLQQALKNNPHAQVVFVKNGGHGEAIQNYQAIIREFFATYLH